MNKVRLVLAPLLCVLCITVIFNLSSDANSNEKTRQLAVKLESKIEAEGSDAAVDKINYVIRKSGHFIEYFILGFILLLVSNLYSFSLKLSLPYILFIILLIANLDEYYQSFIGRTSMVTDCLIDLCGGISGVLINLLILNLFKMNHNKYENTLQ
jgi:VanZ family protein